MAYNQKSEDYKEEPVDMKDTEKEPEYKNHTNLTEKEEAELIAQVDAEFKIAYGYMKPRFDKWKKHIKLYNNQKRDQKAVGNNLVFTLHDTLLASTYDDRLEVTMKAREEGDLGVEEALNLLAEFDYKEMGMAEIDYVTKWDALFYSYGLVDMSGFSIKDKVPTPYNIDPALFYFDPRATSVNGNRQGRGAFRFCGQEIYLTKRELDGNKSYFCVDELENSTSQIKSEGQQIHEARSHALGTDPGLADESVKLGDNSLFQLLEWRTWFKGKRCLVTLGNDRTKIVRYDDKLLEDGWHIVAWHAWKKPHGFIGTSVIDLVEDKQRAMAIILNILLKGLKAGIEPDTLYKPDMLDNKAELLKPGGRKFIAVKNNGSLGDAAAPLQQAQPNMQLISYMLESLNTSAQAATATPEIQQGVVSKEQRTLGELNIIAQKVDTRYSLLTKNLMKGASEFWEEWYRSYKKYFKDGIVEKIMRLDTVTKDKFRKITRENIIAKGSDPDVKVESKLLSEAAQMRQLGKWVQFYNVLAQDPTADKRFVLKKIGQNSGINRQDIDGAMPPTIDEMVARRENEMLNENKSAPVRKTDNHMMHLAIHAEANSTNATYAHIETHKKAMLMQKTNPELFPELQQQQQGLEQGQNAQPMQPGQMQEQGKMMTTPASL